jgi:hypothetical protein
MRKTVQEEDRSVRNWATELALSPIDLLECVCFQVSLDVAVCEAGWAGGGQQVFACWVEVCDVRAEEVVLYEVASLVGAKEQGGAC